MIRRLLAIFCVIVLSVSAAEAGCQSTGANDWTADTNAQADVLACQTLAVSGDTVHVPQGSGTVSWPFTLFNKGIRLVGPGSSLLTVTLTSTLQIGQNSNAAQNPADGFQISDFTLDFNGTRILIAGGVQQFRIHHNHIKSTTLNYPGGVAIELWGQGPNGTGPNGSGGSITVFRPNEGLIDNNIIDEGKIVNRGTTLDMGGGTQIWAQPLDMGTVHAVYIEDNEFNVTGDRISQVLQAVDMDWGGRVVFRFNTMNSSRIDVHGQQGENHRGTRLWEFYSNRVTNINGTPARWLIRAGTGVAFHNQIQTTLTLGGDFAIDSPRLSNPLLSWPNFGPCDGLAHAYSIDENTPGFEGWLCRDQIGASTDVSQWGYSISAFSTIYVPTAPAQARAPVYLWRNTRQDTGGEWNVYLNCTDTTYCTRMTNQQIVENRDWYNYNAAFDGTSGVGEGTLAERPATCTTGVGYWATDQGGNWNTSQTNPRGVQMNGADGALYQCTATNTWTPYYTPYTYPHPLQGFGNQPSKFKGASGGHRFTGGVRME